MNKLDVILTEHRCGKEIYLITKERIKDYLLSILPTAKVSPYEEDYPRCQAYNECLREVREIIKGVL
jgi:hypothetical protein